MSGVNKIQLIRLGIILAVLSCVSACGQKGDLYLPPETTNNTVIDTATIA